MFGFELENHSVELVLKLRATPIKQQNFPWRTPVTPEFFVGNNKKLNDAAWCQSLNSDGSDLYNHLIFIITMKGAPEIFVEGKIDHGTQASGSGAMILELASSPINDLIAADLITHIFSLVTKSIEFISANASPPLMLGYGNTGEKCLQQHISLSNLPLIFKRLASESNSTINTKLASYNINELDPFELKLAQYIVITTQEDIEYRYDILEIFLVRYLEDSNHEPLQLQGTVGIPIAIFCQNSFVNDPMNILYGLSSSETRLEYSILSGIRSHYADLIRNRKCPRILDDNETIVWAGLCGFLSFIVNIFMFGENTRRAELIKNIFYLYPKTGLNMICSSKNIENLNAKSSNKVRTAFFSAMVIDTIYIHDHTRDHQSIIVLSHTSQSTFEVNGEQMDAANKLILLGVHNTHTISTAGLAFKILRSSLLFVKEKLGKQISRDLGILTDRNLFTTLANSTDVNETFNIIASDITRLSGHRIDYVENTLDTIPIAKFEVRQPPTSISRRSMRDTMKIMSRAFFNFETIVGRRNQGYLLPRKTETSFHSDLKNHTFLQMKKIIQDKISMKHHLYVDHMQQILHFDKIFTAAKDALYFRVINYCNTLTDVEKNIIMPIFRNWHSSDNSNPWLNLQTLPPTFNAEIKNIFEREVEDFMSYLYEIT